MLKDITPRPGYARDAQMNAILSIISGKPSGIGPAQHATGVYEFGHWNPQFEVMEKLDDAVSYMTPEGMDWKDYIEQTNREAEAMEARYANQFNVPYHPLSSYGVCDSYHQILARWPHLAADPEPYMIALVEVRKEDQSADGGWRWHKWGDYIGSKDPQYEYLFDEPDIDVVFTFHIYSIGAMPGRGG